MRFLGLFCVCMAEYCLENFQSINAIHDELPMELISHTRSLYSSLSSAFDHVYPAIIASVEAFSSDGFQQCVSIV